MDKKSILESRAATEVRDIYEKVALGFWWSFARPVFEVALIGGSYYLLHRWIKTFSPLPECMSPCFSAWDGSGQEPICCYSHSLFIAHAIAYFLILFVSGYLSTKFKKQNKLQHSATITALCIAITLPLLWYWGYPRWSIPLVAVASFLASFQGYSLWFRLRDRERRRTDR